VLDRLCENIDPEATAHDLMNEAIGALMHMGVQCTAQAHVRMYWEKDIAEPL
jgi:hypothetical protein